MMASDIICPKPSLKLAFRFYSDPENGEVKAQKLFMPWKYFNNKHEVYK